MKMIEIVFLSLKRKWERKQNTHLVFLCRRGGGRGRQFRTRGAGGRLGVARAQVRFLGRPFRDPVVY